MAAAIFWALSLPLGAQESEDAGDAENAHYGRVQLVEGRFSLVRAYDGERVPLEGNLPLVPGDRLETEEAGRLEAGLADTSVLRARGPLQLDIHALAAFDPDESPTTHLMLHRGDLSLEIAGIEERSEPACQVDTPAGTAYLVTEGLYRIRVDADGRVIVWVREGVAEVEGSGSTVLARGGQSTQLVKGRPPTDPSMRVSELDEFERWVEARRAALAEDEVGEEIVEDLPVEVQPYAGELSRYGRWETLPTYGTVWAPYGTGAGWLPYYNGYWVGSSIGHVWVSHEPWGWAPYHYGRWCWVAGSGWVWLPGGLFAGAWVEWWAGPSYVAWVPLGYRDRPAIDVHVLFSARTRFPRSGWACIPYPQFYSRDLQRRYVRDPRALGTHLGQAVPVRRLPGFHARDLRTRPGIGAELFAQVQRASLERSPGRRFHPAEARVRAARMERQEEQLQVGPGASPVRPRSRLTRRPAQPPRREGTHVVRTTTLDRQVGRSLPPASSARARADRPDSASVAPGRGQAVAGEQKIRELLDGAARRSSAPPARGRTAGPQRPTRSEPRPQQVRAAPSARSQAPKADRAPRGQSGPSKNPPRKPKHH